MRQEGDLGLAPQTTCNGSNGPVGAVDAIRAVGQQSGLVLFWDLGSCSESAPDSGLNFSNRLISALSFQSPSAVSYPVGHGNVLRLPDITTKSLFPFRKPDAPVCRRTYNSLPDKGHSKPVPA